MLGLPRAYHERTHRNPLECSGNWSRWQQIYQDAGGMLPGECPPLSSGGQAAPSSAGVPRRQQGRRRSLQPRARPEATHGQRRYPSRTPCRPD